MVPQSNDDLAGMPLMAPVKKAAFSAVTSTAIQHEIFGRDAAEEPLPLGFPSIMQAVSPDAQSARDAKRAKIAQERERAELLRAETANKTFISRILRKLSITVVLVVAGLGGLMLWTQVIQAIAMIGSWSFWPWSIAVATLVAVAILVVGSAGRLIWFTAKFRRNRPVAKMLLEQRERLRDIAQHVDGEAKTLLGKYMAEYPLDDAAHEAFLRKCGVSESELDAMKRNQLSLLDGGNRQDAASWQQTFTISYLGPLDKAARQIIREHAILCGLKTAICPYSLLDMSVVIYMGSAMLGSLCRVYQLRAGPMDMVYLFGLVLGQAFFAGRIEEQSDEIASWLDGTMGDVFEHAGSAVPDLAANLLGKLAAKGSQGLANGLLLNRIGRQATKMLRPIQ